MSSTTPPSAPPHKKGRKPERPDNMADATQTANEELKGRLLDAHPNPAEYPNMRAFRSSLVSMCEHGEDLFTPCQRGPRGEGGLTFDLVPVQ
ncbi:hypothetical protein NHX12_010778 [Muraenolepis orangiensis]|uniref:Uncharacterized protein n=1 Tax=Muraenolepis orangiensis TaxID=630683 RepID=A0A9Q0DHN7_9TELE|nr:hypothetical protein NHX12_010778 [Muraenolepis orangiensis]